MKRDNENNVSAGPWWHCPKKVFIAGLIIGFLLMIVPPIGWLFLTANIIRFAIKVYFMPDETRGDHGDKN